LVGSRSRCEANSSDGWYAKEHKRRNRTVRVTLSFRRGPIIEFTLPPVCVQVGKNCVCGYVRMRVRALRYTDVRNVCVRTISYVCTWQDVIARGYGGERVTNPRVYRWLLNINQLWSVSHRASIGLPWSSPRNNVNMQTFTKVTDIRQRHEIYIIKIDILNHDI